ncbi:MAG TPA: diguanylate cyclase [Rudaea sp.]|nr:diguanylate cyclase [Rudaea sp.]
MRISSWCLFAVLGVISPLIALAQPTTETQPIDLFDIGAPAFTTFSVRDGVPDSVTVTVQTDREGFIWLGSPQGLARYDGQRWKALDDPALKFYIDNLYLDHDGVLWASSREHGIGRYDGQRWHFDGSATGLTSERLRRVTETTDAHGNVHLWALTWDSGLFRFRNGRWEADPGNAQLPPGPLISLAMTHTLDGNERLWVGTGNQGLWYREGSGWQQFHRSGFDPGQIEDLLATRDANTEQLWISTLGKGLWRLDGNGLQSWTTESGALPADELYDMARTTLPNGDHALWVASRSGLVRLYHGRARVFDRRHGLPSDALRGLSTWRSPSGVEVVWLATESGVARLIVGANQWNTASLMGAHSVGVFGVLIDADGKGGQRLWVASAGDGLGLYEGGRWRHFTQSNGFLPDAHVRMIKHANDIDGKPGLWVGERAGFLLRVRDGPRFETVPTPWPQDAGQAVMDMLSRKIDGSTEQWFATRATGIYRLRGKTWTAFRPTGVHGQWSTSKLIEQIDEQGRSWLWATSNQGLARFDGKQWTLLGKDAGLPGIGLLGLSLLPDAHKRPVLWVGSTHFGIIRVDVADPAHPRVLPADLPSPPDPTAYSAVRDSTGRVYVCTNNGVQLLTPRAGRYDSRAFTRRDGMVHDECNINAQFVDAHDRFWTGTLGGLTVYDPNREISDHHAKPLLLTAIAVHGKPVDRDNVLVPPGQHDVRVDYALLSWQHENESRFRTQLIGYEQAPGEWSAQSYRDFSALPAGTYTLHVDARDYAGNMSKPLEIPVTIAPHWWQQSWAWLLFAVAAFAAGFGLVRWRTRQLEQQRRTLEEVVADRTAELRDANARLIELSYRDALTDLANRRTLLEALEPDAIAAASSALPSALIFIDVDHFKEYNDHFGHPAGDEALRTVANVLRACAPHSALVARYGGEEFACLLVDTDTPHALELAEQIRASVANADVPLPGSNQVNHVTISAGVASSILRTAADAHQMLHDADTALYQAKNAGRNCVRS